MTKKELSILLDTINKLLSGEKIKTCMGEYTELSVKEYEMIKRFDGVKVSVLYEWDDTKMNMGGFITFACMKGTTSTGKKKYYVECANSYDLCRLVQLFPVMYKKIKLPTVKGESEDEI